MGRAVKRSNNLDALRLLGAVLVIIGHAYHLLRRETELPFVLGFPVSTLGVVIFFSISGYLICASWTRKRSLVPYLAARCLRIFPGLIAVVLISMLLIGPATTNLPVHDYFGAPRFHGYFSNIWLLPQYDLPGVFSDLPYANAVNGSLWTLPAEFFCYLVVPVVCVRWLGVRIPALIGLLAICLYLAHIPAASSAIIYGTRISDAASMWVYFVAGALLRSLQERQRGLFRTDLAVLALLGQMAITSLYPSAVLWMTWAFLPYAVLAAGLASTPVVRRAARYGDLSYGLYLWAFPVQQLVVLNIGTVRMSVNLMIVTLLSLGLAWLSWHVIEGPSMRLKDALLRRFRTPSLTPGSASVTTEAAA